MACGKKQNLKPPELNFWGLFYGVNMIQNKYIIKSLPLLAAALGKKYGVEVVIGANKSATNALRSKLQALL